MSIEVLSFELTGKFGHFRKFFSTTTSLSYIFPPRTAILGLLGAILGIETYADVVKKLQDTLVGVEVLSNIRKMMITENYLMVKSVTRRELRGVTQRTQIAMEIIRPENSTKMCYRIYVSNNRYIHEIYERIAQRKYRFPIYLGITEFLAQAETPQVNTMRLIETKTPIKTSSVLKFSKIGKILSLKDGIKLYREERVPAELSEDRKPIRIEDYLVPIGGNVEVYYNGKVFANSNKIIGIL